MQQVGRMSADSAEPVARYEVVVVGAGAAGLLAAIRAAECGARTLLLEKNPRAGTKILMSGGTRCNLTHDTDSQGIVQAYGVKGQGRFLHSALAALGPRELVAIVEAEGVPTQVEQERGKVFPVSNRAADVLDAFLRRLHRSGAELALSEPLVDFSREGDGFRLQTARRQLHAERLIITTGGKSYPGSGSSGDGYRWLAALGHTIVELRPALTPITTDSLSVRALRGIAIADARARIVPRVTATDGELVLLAGQSKRKSKSNVLAERREAVLFTHFGLSGPAILDVSRAVSGHPEPRSLDVEIDFLPALSADELDAQIRGECAAEGKRQLASLVVRQLPRRVIETLLAALNLSGEMRAAELSKADRSRLTAIVKGWRVPVAGVRGFQVAEVTAGGVALSEIDSRTMQSKKVPNLYLAGEILDLDGPIGGYNFQAAFSTAWLAGQSAARDAADRRFETLQSDSTMNESLER